MITPTCTTGEVPVGTGGTVGDGSYTLVAETYYNPGHCPDRSLSSALVIEGGCYQRVEHSVPGDQRSAEVRVSFKAHTEGNRLIGEVTCSSTGPRDVLPNTFTATESTLTFFTGGAVAGDADRVEVFVRQ